MNILLIFPDMELECSGGLISGIRTKEVLHVSSNRKSGLTRRKDDVRDVSRTQGGEKTPNFGGALVVGNCVGARPP